MMRVKTPQEIATLREGGKILAHTLQILLKAAGPGARAADLDALAEKTIRETGGIPAFKNFEGFPSTLCISMNSEVVHGIPGDKVFQEGDIVGIDCGVQYNGLFTDAAITVGIGKISKDAKKLITITEQSFREALKVIKAGATTGDIGHAVQAYVEAHGYGVIRALVGHGVGHAVHEEPRVPNYGQPGTGAAMPIGLVIAVEPMVSAGHWQVQTAPDKWTVITADGSLAAHYEHTLVVTENGYEILTI